MSIETALKEFVYNPDNAEANFNIGLEYENQGQTASAFSYYLRAAEKFTDLLGQYESLIRTSFCFDRQKDRNFTVKSMLQQAISVCPDRPEAYFLLSRFHERNHEWIESYMIASIGLGVCNFDGPSLKTHVEYPGRYGLLFQKGVAAWWVGLPDEAREVISDLYFNYKLDSVHKKAVQDNLDSIGFPKSAIPYDNSMYDRLRFKFKDADKIEKNYSQAFQDMFVLSMLNGKKNGLYLEIGSAEPFKNNNTALLEQDFKWKGISIEYEKHLVKEFFKCRSNSVFCLNALDIDYTSLLESMAFNNDIDYLQVDCDPPRVSYEVLTKIPFDQYRFAVISFEHDFYKDPSYKELSREFLRNKGYVLVVNDVAYTESRSFEDWWVHPALVDPDILHLMKVESENVTHIADYMISSH